jgi:hypothetical protein
MRTRSTLQQLPLLGLVYTRCAGWATTVFIGPVTLTYSLFVGTLFLSYLLLSQSQLEQIKLKKLASIHLLPLAL